MNEDRTAQLGSNMLQVLQFVEEYGPGVTAGDVLEETGMVYNTAYVNLARLAKRGYIRRICRGVYGPAEESA